MTEIVTIEETELLLLYKERSLLIEEVQLRLITVSKVRDPDKMIKIKRENSTMSNKYSLKESSSTSKHSFDLLEI